MSTAGFIFGGLTLGHIIFDRSMINQSAPVILPEERKW
ncbi:hypothetical protein SPWS13_2978 [Shewanella putrefaciens]|nr:hypothetical protein SPWS13_2978 [Shewanella putrefaciens]